MTIDIDVAGLCPHCRLDHEATEKALGKKMPVTEDELCNDCKIKLGFKEPKGEPEMKTGKRKYTRRADAETKTGKKPKLDKETKAFIKNLLRSGKKADKYEKKADKLQDRADELRTSAEKARAGIEALKRAVETA